MQAKFVQPETPGILTLELSYRESKILRAFFGGMSTAQWLKAVNDSSTHVEPAFTLKEALHFSSELYRAFDVLD